MQLFKIIVSLGFSLALAFGQSGTVKSEGQPIPGATVRATQGDRVLTTVTDTTGAFTLDKDKMTPGAWAVDVTMFGFEAARREGQVGGSLTKIDFNLDLRQARAPFGRGGAGRGFAERGGASGGPGQNGGRGQNNAGPNNPNNPPANPADPGGEIAGAGAANAGAVQAVTGA